MTKRERVLVELIGAIGALLLIMLYGCADPLFLDVATSPIVILGNTGIFDHGCPKCHPNPAPPTKQIGKSIFVLEDGKWTEIWRYD